MNSTSNTDSGIQNYTRIDELPQQYQDLIKLAKEHTQYSYSPYSQFAVGAAILLENGIMIGGSNQENASYPLCLCAERTAFATAASMHPNIATTTIAVTAFLNDGFVLEPVSPCGACRQVISEHAFRFKTDITVILYSLNKIIVLDSADKLLPLGFKATDLPEKT